MDYPKPTDKDLPPSPADDTKPENPSKKPRYSGPGPLKGDDMEILKKMPSVSTTGNGGRRIKGFLYSYTKSEICIVCVCHGSFFTPEEFVMHAGGKGVENPMKHIIVSSKSF
ncbi:Ninja-family protein AFP3 [Senna tora]|uniref:Ninja-family protein n=1 Tax=Senna tora TaxID=362788 RepID=A0A834W256_9FABA|nr:Ninja-family protein AFP3 [Senna tora]